MIALTALLTLAVGIAVAAYFTNARITGGVTSASYSASWQSLTTSPPPTWTDMQGTVTLNGSAVALNVSSAFQGGSVTFQGKVKASGSGKVIGLAMPGLPTGWTAQLVEGCGASVSSVAFADVEIKVTMTSSATQGSAGTFTPEAGVQVAPDATAPGTITCPTFQGG